MLCRPSERSEWLILNDFAGRVSHFRSGPVLQSSRAALLLCMIKSFRCAETQALAQGDRVKRFANIADVTRRKLRQLEIAGRLDDLRVPPGNRLEALKGNRAGQYSIRINDQWRLCFRWTTSGAEDVEIVDYH